jgi:hypothetical protein
VSAALLFVVQPMVGKMILPLLGGTPAVWSTCLVFFQAALLAGYAYAHATTAWLGARRQAVLHLLVLLLALAALPLGIDPARLRGGETSPVLDVLLLLVLSVGLPFVVVSASAPLFQTWFASTRHAAARDPYFLYAASNLGSLLALISYPTLIEPRLDLVGSTWLSQTRLWMLGYLLLTALTFACAVLLWRSRPAPESREVLDPAADAAENSPTWRRRLRWCALAAVPASLLLGTTTYITTDVAAVPLLWSIPLALYLLTFILAFGRWPGLWHRAVVAATLPAVLAVLFVTLSGYTQRIWVAAFWHLGLLFVVALALHGELARLRPPPRHLTEFYLVIALGGVLGGALNALLAPALFSSLAEYPIAMVLACVLARPRRADDVGWRTRLADVGVAAAVGVLTLVLYSHSLNVRVDVSFLARVLDPHWEWGRSHLDPIETVLNRVLLYGPPLFACFGARRRPFRLGLSLLCVLLAAWYVEARNTDRILQARSFFGVLKVTRDTDTNGYTRLRHGTTLHGQQSLDPARRQEPLAYYHRQGPIGQVFRELYDRGRPLRVAVIGLGPGTLAAYARAGDTFTFYEIDQLVRRVASDPANFTFLDDARARGAELRIELGDARVRLEAIRKERPTELYDLIVVDAFSSDAIPVHLLTREALHLYLDALSLGGLLAFHISNRYLDLEPVLANLARDAAVSALVQHDDAPEEPGAARSTWVVVAPNRFALGNLASAERWTSSPLTVDPGVGVWTDNFHNLLTVLRWK